MRRILVTCMLFPPLAALVCGCAVLAPGAGYSGGSATLSDAVEAAQADTTTKVRRLDAGASNPPVVVTETEAAAPLEPVEPTVAVTPEPKQKANSGQHVHFGAIYGTGVLGGTQYDRLEAFGLSGGAFETGNVRWDITALATSTYFSGESRQGHAFKDAIDLELDVTGRWYLTHPNTFMGAYGLVGAGTGTVFWDYANRLPVVHDGVATTVGDDHINHFDFFTGAGVSVMQLRHLHVGTNLVVGVRFYGWHTYQGFDNTELPTTGFARLTVEANYR